MAVQLRPVVCCIPKGATVVAVSDGCILGEAVVLDVDPITKAIWLDRAIPQIIAGVELMIKVA